MKPFNLEEFKAGLPAVTKDGRKVTYLHTLQGGYFYQFVAVVRRKTGFEEIEAYDCDGETASNFNANIAGMYELKSK